VNQIGVMIIGLAAAENDRENAAFFPENRDFIGLTVIVPRRVVIHAFAR